MIFHNEKARIENFQEELLPYELHFCQNDDKTEDSKHILVFNKLAVLGA